MFTYKKMWNGKSVISLMWSLRLRLKNKTRGESKGLTKANEKKIDIIYAKRFVKSSKSD